MKIRDGNPYLDISPGRARALKPGWRRPLPVLVRVNGQPARKPWRINLMPTGTGAFYLYLHGDVRRASNPPIFLVAQIGCSTRAQRRARTARALGQEGPVHGPIVERWSLNILRRYRLSQ